jgi:hypothetical protein
MERLLVASATVQVNVRLDPELYAAVKAKADSESITVTQAADAAFRKYVRTSTRGENTK